MFANEDIYTGTTNPTSTINPKITGAFYINKKTAKLFVCKDNTLNKNIWEMCNPDVVIPKYEPDGLGYNQRYKELIDKHNIWFTNNTNKPIYVVCWPSIGSRNTEHYIDVKDTSGTTTAIGFYQSDPNDNFMMSCVVPPYFSYKLRVTYNRTTMWVLS